ncbi:hypothetical protein NMG60_11034259 [Bertholletia excelsa]
MWPQRTKSRALFRTPSSNFSCSSFKDILSICSGDFDRANSPRSSIFHRVRVAKSLIRTWSSLPKLHDRPFSASPICLPGTENSIVVYFTSLRIVRSTFDDCRAVRSILRAFRVSIDERDVSMDCKFMDELQRILGTNHKSKLTLPRVFIGGRYIGGAEEIRQMNESGELKKLLGALPAANFGVCEVCGGYGFILCNECSGSHKCYLEKGGFRTCTACNVNGLIRCPSCSSAPL